MNPNIEVFKQTLKRQKGIYVPVAELGIHFSMMERFLGRPIQNLKDEVDFWHKSGYDYIKLQPRADFNPGQLFLQDSENATFNDDGTISRNWATEGKGVISSWEDFEKYEFPKRSDFDYGKFEEVVAYLPEGMGIIGQYGDIFTMVWEMMGFENFSFALYDNAELVQAMFDKIGDLVFSMFENFAECDAVDVLWYSDDIAYASGMMLSPAVFRQYFFPWLRKIGDLARSSNKPFIYHTDGNVFDTMEDIIDSGVDALHPIEPQAMDIAEVKERFGDRLSLIGHVDVDLLARGTPAEVRRKVRENIEVAGYNGGYCVGSGNSVPDYVKYENFIAMLEAAREFGR